MSAPLRIVRVANTPRPWIDEWRTLYARFGRCAALVFADAAVDAGLRAFTGDFEPDFAVLRGVGDRRERAGIGQCGGSAAPIVARDDRLRGGRS
jgi:hypothetical protein